jgi:hypothetical protein
VVLDAFTVGTRLWQRLPVRWAEWLLVEFPQLQMKVDMDVDALGWLPPLETAAGPR